MRATYEDWRSYYERAERVRAQVGDPFQRLIAREALHRRLLRVGVIVFVMAALIALVWFVISLANGGSLESISEAASDRGDLAEKKPAFASRKTLPITMTT